MTEPLTRDDVRDILDGLERSIARPECRTCDCLAGLVTRLELDGGAEVRELLEPWKVSREDMHGCLGCNPCPPAEVYVDYIRTQRGRACCR